MTAGRKSTMTDEKLQKLRQAFSIGCSDREACVYADVALSTLYNYQNANPEFIEEKAGLKEKPVLLARQVVVKSLEKEDVKTAQWLLERKKRKEFATRTESEIRQVEAFDNLTDDELKKIADGVSATEEE